MIESLKNLKYSLNWIKYETLHVKLSEAPKAPKAVHRDTYIASNAITIDKSSYLNH